MNTYLIEKKAKFKLLLIDIIKNNGKCNKGCFDCPLAVFCNIEDRPVFSTYEVMDSYIYTMAIKRYKALFGKEDLMELLL